MEIKNYFAQDAQGNIMPSANCYLYLPGTTTLATGLVDGNGTPISNPFLASSVGQVEFGAPNGVYDLRVALGARDWTIEIQCADLLQALNETASFLGEKSSAPTTRNDGSPLQIADRYFNSSDQLEYLYKSTGWVANNLDGQIIATNQGASLVGALMQDGTTGTVQEAINEGDIILRGELEDPDNTLIGFIRGPFGESQKTVAGMLSAQTLNAWEFMEAIPSIDKIDPAEPSTWYWDAAINAALQKGKKVVLTNMFKIRNKISSKVTGSQLVGDGIDSAGLILDQIGSPGASFTGNVAIEFGDATVAAATTTHMGLSSFSINMGGRDIRAVSMLGLRDGSYAKRIYIRNFTKGAFKTNMAGDGVGVASGKMCEGVKIEQIIAFPQNGVTDDIFLFDGIFESEASLCKAFGYTLGENNAVGYAIGKATETRGFKLNLCSAANMVKFGNPANKNLAVTYGEWARDNWDYNTTMENIEGGGIEHNGGTASGVFLPLNCRSVDPRPFFSSNLEVLNPLFKFRKANACFAKGVNYYSTVKTTFEFTAEGGLNSFGALEGGLNPETLISSGVVVFAAGSSNSNYVTGHSSAVTIRKEFVLTVDQQFYRVLANGANEQSDSFWTTFNMGAAGKYRWRNAALDVVASIDDGTAMVSGKTALSIRSIKSTVAATDRVEIGAPDSAGTGYRTLRIPN